MLYFPLHGLVKLVPLLSFPLQFFTFPFPFEAESFLLSFILLFFILDYALKLLYFVFLLLNMLLELFFLFQLLVNLLLHLLAICSQLIQFMFEFPLDIRFLLESPHELVVLHFYLQLHCYNLFFKLVPGGVFQFSKLYPEFIDMCRVNLLLFL